MTKKKTHQEEGFSLFTELDIHLFREGKHYKLYEKFGAHEVEVEGVKGTYFSVWAPNALSVSVAGNFNHWNVDQQVLHPRWDSSGIWETFVPGIGHGEIYKFNIRTKSGQVLQKSDPFATYWEPAPKTATIVWDTEFKWSDNKWLSKRSETVGRNAPMSVYEVHPGSWKRKEGGEIPYSYQELARELVPYVKEMGFTHVEFLPVMEHPFYGSWGYQLLGYFAPTSRYGSPQDFMEMINAFHKEGIGVILDWVPSHFPGDEHGLYKFDGTHLFEHEDPRKGYHPDWTSYIFNYGRNEVRSFLISSAMCWLDKYHIDGLRVDAVASMLYLDYSRKDGEWEPNEYGGNENLEAINFLKELNIALYKDFPDIITIAEESTSWPNVSKPTYIGGLGFGQKWMMGWMHDSLEYFRKDMIYRKYHQDEISFSLVYAFTENFMLPLSHDEVVHGKGSLISRMPGDEWQRFANMRLLFGYMYTHPGTKLIFMGGEIGQYDEWDHEKGLDWNLLYYNCHLGLQSWVKDLNDFYKKNKALYKLAFDQRGFEWIDHSDFQNSVLVFMRKTEKAEETLIIVCNFTPTVRHHYRIGVPFDQEYIEILNSDASKYGGSNILNTDVMKAEEHFIHGRPLSIALTLPPLGLTVLKLR
ncbi:MAG: 1,4-alpha-glucan branching protein GlgB [Cyclobacteriaceae bacterium]|nr:1,4-alpha-glucan branching protein GlgB [Cyclobacteriaceae bacterium]